ncbi:MAG TPA: hypothetical protein PLB49_06635 [Chitinophagaceae bacterium]|nr:hypothetical protein [Chitinophagaceae bacterium]
MKRGLTLSIIICLLSFSVNAQPAPQAPNRLKVFFDCSSTWCDMTYIRSEINIVDFLLDNKAADVHLLITSQGTGSGGDQYQLIFFGQNQFSRQPDTLRFNTDPNITEFEERELLIRYIKLGLAPFIARTAAAKDITISYKSGKTDSTVKTVTKLTNDPWNYWVYRVGANGNMDADEVYKNFRYSVNLSANRTTEEVKLGFSMSGSRNRSAFEYDDGTGLIKYVVNNHNFSMGHYLVKSINSHWSWGYETNYSQNTFSNNRGRIFLRTALEYNIFPYKEVNTRSFTLSYGITARQNRYYDTTLYNKLKENLYGHGFNAHMTYNQKWGTSYIGVNYHNYFHDWKYFNLGMEAYTSVRVTGGLSFYISAFGGLSRDQFYLQKGSATSQEVLARQRQLASGYSYYFNLGINYRFGSKLNNFVNPRFDGTSNSN